MLQFPVLKTGAVAQYPLGLTFNYHTDIVWFLDGSEQRFRNAPSVLHQWKIALEQLDEQEMQAVEAFFILSVGAAQTFAFTDPASTTTYPNCSVDGDVLKLDYTGPLSGKTSLVIRENRT
jgi:hypothetical protein